MLQKIDFKGGKIIYDSFNVDVTKPLEEQLWEIREDLMHIEYGEDYFIDVGFYPEGDPNGSFVMRVIKNLDWEKPVMEKEAKREYFFASLQECINFVDQLIKK